MFVNSYIKPVYPPPKEKVNIILKLDIRQYKAGGYNRIRLYCYIKCPKVPTNSRKKRQSTPPFFLVAIQESNLQGATR